MLLYDNAEKQVQIHGDEMTLPLLISFAVQSMKS